MRKTMTVMALLVGAAAPARAGDRALRAEVTVPAPLEDVWRAWTTEAGVKTFFAPGARIEPRVDGLYEILFNPEGEAGRRGAEGMRILAFEPPRRLAFTWNAPPDLPDVRAQRTMVVVTLEPQEDGHTRLRFAHIGWGEGGDWDRAYAYFDRAWRAVVLPRLVHRFKGGPVDWSRPPTLEPVAASLRTE
ncbi:MAG TPA: SRPBCC domain-containing protein [Vicinamibacteria bacterium]|jgi:uncharacterized protein YndB with AHSA1/START domain